MVVFMLTRRTMETITVEVIISAVVPLKGEELSASIGRQDTSNGSEFPNQKTHSPSSHPEIILTVTGNENNPSPLPPWELDVLYDLYSSTQGEYWIWTGVPWNFSESNANPCSEAWEGVSCFEVCSNTVNGSESCGEHIYSIVLSNNNMTGSLPSSLGQLQQMHYLGLTDNLNLTGTIPSIFSNLSYLSYLMLNNNALT
eukprot:scaffold964_cov159-Ochromonas_danica.AAC.1